MLERKLGCSCGLCRRGLDWGAALVCGGEGWIGARMWFVGARLDLARGVDCGGGMTVMRRYRNCVKRRCGKKVRKVANL
ncbi:MAG: hypothetical protein ACLTAN_05060 [Christensenellaceae bacterium]